MNICYVAYFAYLINKMITFDDDRTYKFQHIMDRKTMNESIQIDELGFTQFQNVVYFDEKGFQ